MGNEPLPSTTAEKSAAPSTQPASLEAHESLFAVPHAWKVASVVAIVMVLLALLGVGLSTTSSSSAPAYWISLVPIYGLLCIATAWARARHTKSLLRPVVVRQLFHWLGIGVALGMDFFIHGTGQETGTASGLNALLLLALGCYLAGVHFEWLFTVVGVLLTLALFCVAKADQYVWLIFVVGAAAIAAMLIVQWLLSRERFRKAAPGKLPS
jgi:hypothetical protein